MLLLQRPDLQVADVAYMVGFTDPKYFSLIFKKEKGMSQQSTWKHRESDFDRFLPSL